MKKEDKSNLVDDAEEEPQEEPQENGFVGDKEAPMKSTTVRLCGNWKLEGLTLVILVVVIFSIAVTVAMVIHILVGPPQVVPHGAATSMSDTCSQAAVDVMHKHNGGGVDGAVAAALCESVTLAHATGFGGGALIFVYSQGSRNGTLYDCREAAPSDSKSDMFKGKKTDATSGGLSVAVPGYLKCLYTAHKKFGKTKWATLVEPAIKAAEKGFPMPSELHAKLKSDTKLFNKVKASPTLSKLYLNGNKTSPIASGAIIKRPKLAALLKKISSEKDNDFYNGKIADEIVKSITDAGGIMKKTDLSSYKARSPDMITGHFNHFTILSFPLPSMGGPLMLSALNAIDAYGVYRSLLPNETSIPHQVKSPNSMYYQRLVQILRTSLFNMDNIGASSNASAISSMLTGAAAKNLIKSINANSSVDLTGKALAPLSDKALYLGESTLSVQGPDNVMVSVSSCLGSAFGSGVVTPSGIILNNAMGSFSLPDVSPVNTNNLPGPNLRPLTPMAPFVVHNPRRRCGVRFTASTSGGLVAPQASIQVVVAALLWNVPNCREKDCLDLAAAVTRSRLAVQPNKKEVEVEPGIPTSAVDYLKTSGSTIKKVPKSLGDVQSAGEVQHVVRAYSDSRYSGKAITY